jgi:hypothetical protein
MSARGISQTSSGEAATRESPAEKCRVRTRKQRESRRSLDRSSIFSRKARNRQENAAHGRSRGSLISASFVRGNCGPAFMTLKLFCDRVEVCSRRKCKTQPATDALEKTAGLGH